MSETVILEQPIITPAVAKTIDESTRQGNVAIRKTIVYKTLIDPAVLRIAGEKNKCRLFNDSLFWRYRPEEIDFVSIEKYYEPYIAVNGKYSVDYYRQGTYTVKVGKEVKEVLLFNHTHRPEETTTATGSEHKIKIEVEERLFKEKRAFLFLNCYGQDAKFSEFPSGPSEKNPEDLIKDFKMREISPNMDVDIIRSRIAERPYDVKRIVEEVFQIDERSLVYAPRFTLTYKCLKTGKEASIVFDGVTAKPLKLKDNLVIEKIKSAYTKLKEIML
jgi:hypothetical protein